VDVAQRMQPDRGGQVSKTKAREVQVAGQMPTDLHKKKLKDIIT
jgi:hypothetical protein